MKKRVELTQAQKDSVIKVFKKSDTMKDLVDEFIKSFKALEERTDGNTDTDYYVIWSSLTQKTIKIPVKELLG